MLRKNKLFLKMTLPLTLTTLPIVFIAACQPTNNTKPNTPDPIDQPVTPEPNPNPQPENPAPIAPFTPAPTPSQPQPAQPNPEQPNQVQPKPVQPNPVQPNPAPSQPNPAPSQPNPVTAQPTPKQPTPAKPTYSIIRPALQTLIKNNDKGFSPSSVKEALESKQNDTSNTQWLKELLNLNQQSILKWSDVSTFNLEANDDKGELNFDFSVAGKKLAISLNTDDGLMKTTDYYDQIKKLTFSISSKFESIALATTGSNPQFEQQVSEPNGTMFGGGYTTGKNSVGTGWIIDRIKNANDGSSETLSYLVGTNIHVGSIAEAFFDIFDQKDAALDPLNIQFGWKRNQGFGNNSGFDGTLVNQGIENFITNLRFGKDNLLAGQFNQTIETSIIERKLNKIESWFQPTAAMTAQKKTFLESLIFSPKHQTSININGQEFTYQSLGADFMVLRMDFKKADLQAQWPELFESYQNKTENQLFLGFNTTKALNLQNTFYSGGYPAYYPSSSAANKYVYKAEGFDPGKQTQGEYWKATTLTPFPSENNQKNTQEELISPEWMRTITHWNNEVGFLEINDTEKLRYIDWFNQNDFDQMWGKKINIKNSLANNQVEKAQLESSPAYQISHRDNNSETKIMVRQIYRSAKKHITSMDKQFIGGNSGSMIINSKKEIVGIFSFIFPQLIESGKNNGVFFDFYNTYSGMEGDKIYGLNIAQKLRDKNIKTSIINP